MQSFMPTRFFVFKIKAIKNGFAGPKSFRGFRETGPSSVDLRIEISAMALRVRTPFRTFEKRILGPHTVVKTR